MWLNAFSHLSAFNYNGRVHHACTSTVICIFSETKACSYSCYHASMHVYICRVHRYEYAPMHVLVTAVFASASPVRGTVLCRVSCNARASKHQCNTLYYRHQCMSSYCRFTVISMSLSMCSVRPASLPLLQFVAQFGAACPAIPVLLSNNVFLHIIEYCLRVRQC